jgi:hypothetical protein
MASRLIEHVVGPLRPRGAGLGPVLGAYWYYQGITLGYRVLYAYFPSDGAVIVLGLNSRPDTKQNHDGALSEEVYGILQKAERSKRSTKSRHQIARASPRLGRRCASRHGP